MRSQAKASTAGSTQRRGSRLGPLLGALLIALLALPSASFAARPYQSQLTEANGAAFLAPFGLATDPADNLWVSDTGNGSASKFDSSGAYLTQASGFAGCGGSYIEGLAYGNAADLLYVSDSCSDDVWGIEADGAYAGVDLNSGLGGGCCFIRVAVDNSGGSSDGDLYVSSGGEVIRIDGSGNPADFSSPESYVEGNRLKGTSDHSFAGPGALTTDSAGRLYVADPGNGEVDEFDSSGAFVRAFTGLSSISALAVDPVSGNLLIADPAANTIRELDFAGASVGKISAAATPAGSFAGPQGLAVDSSGRLYVADSGNAVIDVFGNFVAGTPPGASVENATEVTYSTAHVKGEVDPQGEATEWRFQYATQADFSDAVDGPSGTVEGDAQAVEGDLSDLAPNTTYHLRLIAENGGGEVQADADATFTTLPAAPVITHTFFTDVTTSEATLHAEINPGGAATTYRFQYITEAGFKAAGNTFAGAIQTPTTPLDGAADNSSHLASATLSGLQPDTTYRYRALATNSVGSAEGDGKDHVLHTYAVPDEIDFCPNAERRAEQHSAYLPACRAYELVSGVDKNGGDILVDGTRVRAAADGGAVVFSSLAAFGDVGGSFLGADYLAARSAMGWSVHGITPTQEPLPIRDVAGVRGGRPDYPLLSGDLSKGVFKANTPLTDDPFVASSRNLYLRRDLRVAGAGSYELVSPASTPQSPPATAPRPVPFVAGASRDLEHVVFEATANLTDEAVAADLSTEVPKLYEWVGGTLRLIGILPAAEGGGPAPSSQAGQGASNLFRTDSTVSADGSRVVFTVPDAQAGCSPQCGALYVRDDQGTLGTDDDETIRVSISERTDCAVQPGSCAGTPAPDPAGSRPVTFWAASSDASQIFFTSRELLTDDDHSTFLDLYRYDLDAAPGRHLTRISVDHEPSDGDGAEVAGVLGISEDGSYVYFAVIQAQLAAGGPTGPTGGPIGDSRIMVWHNGEIHHVAGVNGSIERGEIASEFTWFFSTKNSEVTPDGRHLVFVSSGTDELTGYDHNVDATECVGFYGTPPCREVYVYDASANDGAGALMCASCNPTGQPATRDASIVARYAWGFSTRLPYQNRSITEDGHFVFFSSAERLVFKDTNGVSDAYQYDTTTGQIRLLSSGTSPTPSFFLEASASGDHVFFTTREQLISGDTDELTDLYDAPIGGGFPEPKPVPEPCAGDACRGTQRPTPTFAAPATHSFAGAGNSRPRKHRSTKCKRGRVRKRMHHKVKCVKRTSHRNKSWGR